MPDTGDKRIWFRRGDIKPLHDMPSAQAHDPIVVRGHHPVQGFRRFGQIVVALIVALGLIAGLGIAAIEAGLADGPLTAQAEKVLTQAAGAGGQASVGSAVVRMSGAGGLALVARDVTVKQADAVSENRIERISIALETLPLLTGQLRISEIEVDGAALTLPNAAPDRPDIPFRIDSISNLVETGFIALNRIVQRLVDAGTGAIRFSDIELVSSGGEPVVVRQAVLSKASVTAYTIEATIAVGGQDAILKAQTTERRGQEGLSYVSGTLSGLRIDVASERVVSDDPFEARGTGIRTGINARFEMARAGLTDGPRLRLTLEADSGSLLLGGIDAPIDALRLNAAYEPGVDKIEILPSILTVGETRLPFTGGLIDIDRLPGAEQDAKGEDGFAFDLVVSPGVAAPGDSDEQPIPFEAKAFGRYIPKDRRLVSDRLAVVSDRGGMVGSMALRFSPGESPAITFVANTDRMATPAVKQLWPYWLGKRARQWVLNNLYGGFVTDGTLQVSVPQGFFKPGERPVFSADQLRINFSVERARMNVAGDIPPLRDTAGSVRIEGSELHVLIESATNYFPTGRKVDVSNARFSIADAAAIPVMADLTMAVSGNADAVAELITYHPIAALDRIGRKPEDFSGTINADVSARFGLVRNQEPPPPDWRVELQLEKVDLATPVEGRSFKAVDGLLKVSPDHAELSGSAMIDGVALKVDIMQPIGASPVRPVRHVAGTLDDKAREKLAPGSGAVLQGPIGFDMQIEAGKPSLVRLDLKRAKLTVPGAGWAKEPGVAAKASFRMSTEEGATRITELDLSGNGFSAAGNLLFSKGRFSEAQFSSVRLSPQDNYAASVKASGNGYDVSVRGKSFDARSLIMAAKKTAATRPEKASGARIRLEGRADVAYGFGGETLSGVVVTYSGTGKATDALDFRGVTASGQAVVLKVQKNGGTETVDITSGDAGAFARFADLYERIRGGLLNIRLTGSGDGRRRGVVDIRNFEVRGEPRIQSLVSSGTGRNGQSLNDAVKGRIDAGRARFEVASARVVTTPGQLDVSQGIVRGPEIGAAFNGTVYDAKGRINLSGTFMPAYGINRLFGDLPLIGALLGNGRDGALIGITFRLTGSAKSPAVEVNPLSAIAPGVFRSIFEFRR